MTDQELALLEQVTYINNDLYKAAGIDESVHVIIEGDTATRIKIYFFYRELAAGCYGLPFNITLQKEIEAKKGI